MPDLSGVAVESVIRHEDKFRIKFIDYLLNSGYFCDVYKICVVIQWVFSVSCLGIEKLFVAVLISDIKSDE